MGKVTALARFISKSAEMSTPLFATLRKGGKFAWTEECEEAFLCLKAMMATPPVLTRPRPVLIQEGVSPKAHIPEEHIAAEDLNVPISQGQCEGYEVTKTTSYPLARPSDGKLKYGRLSLRGCVPAGIRRSVIRKPGIDLRQPVAEQGQLFACALKWSKLAHHESQNR
ncbi:hypothetical protein CR513_39714, partial [Mucuna pruriens]